MTRTYPSPRVTRETCAELLALRIAEDSNLERGIRRSLRGRRYA